MANYATDRRYLPSHEWVLLEGEEAIVGISDYAQHELSDVVYVDLPEVGETFAKGDSFGTVESVKAASDVYVPLGGEIIAVNDELMDSPQLVNEDPFGRAWMIRIRPSNAAEYDELLDAAAYEKLCQEEVKGAH